MYFFSFGMAEQICEALITNFVNGTSTAERISLANKTRLARDLLFEKKDFQMFAVYLEDILGERFPELENEQVETIADVKQLMIAAIIRQRDRLDKKRKCSNCGKVPEMPNRCSRCKSVAYCDRECQTEHWKAVHKKQCTPPSEQSDLGLFSLVRVAPARPEHGLVTHYLNSRDHCDTNLLICVHGNGDNEVNFTKFCTKFELPVTALLGVRGCHPFQNKGHFWYPDLDMLQGKIPGVGDRTRIAPVWEAAQLLVEQIKAAEKYWPCFKIFLLGHRQGGVIAVDAARRYEKTLGGVIASGSACLEESIVSDPIPTKIEKISREMFLGDTILFHNLELVFVASQPNIVDDDATKRWQYELTAYDNASKSRNKKELTVVFDQSDFGNGRARAKLITLWNERYRVRLSNYHRDSVLAEFETRVEDPEDENLKVDSRLLFTTGEKDTALSKKMAEIQEAYIRRKFNAVECRRYEDRKDVLGTSGQEIADIVAFVQMCSSKKPPLRQRGYKTIPARK